VRTRAFSFLILLALATLMPAALPLAANAAPALNQVSVTIQTSQNLSFQYTLTAYNTSGYQVTSYFGLFPQAAFGLPAGTYLLTASAYYQQAYCSLCPLGSISSGPAVAAKGSPTIAMPIRYVPPYAEYGYAVVQVSAPQQLTIQTRNDTSAPLVSVPVHVAFANGTAASGASVSAYVVGSYSVYNQQMVTSGQTGADGNVSLVLPEEPVQVSAYMSLPLQLPENVSTVTVTVGGEKVNVTVYWQPNYIDLVGQALILPPQMSAELTLHVQQTFQPPIYYGAPGMTTGVAVTSTTTGGAVAPGSGAASQQQAPSTTKIAPFNPTGAQLTPQNQQGGSLGGPNPMAAILPEVAVAAGAVVVGVAVTVLLQRRKL
jgi:hypothetical protein